MKTVSQEEFQVALKMHGAWLKGELGGKRMDFSECDLRGVNMEGANMEEANMAGANMTRANMAGANMEEANMAGANMEGADMGPEHGKLLHAFRSVLHVGNVGSKNAFLTAFFCKRAIVVRRGCFYGTLEEFETKVREVHADNEFGKEYASVIRLIRDHAEIWGLHPMENAA